MQKLEDHCKAQQEIIQHHEGAILHREQSYKEPYSQSEAMYQQLIMSQKQLHDQEQIATGHIQAIKDMATKASIKDKDVNLAIENSDHKDRQIAELWKQVEDAGNLNNSLKTELQEMKFSIVQQPNDPNIIEQLDQQCKDLIEKAKIMKANYEAQLTERDEIITEHAKNFRRMSEQQQSATMENIDLTDRITEMTETMDTMSKKMTDLEKENNKVKINPITASLREAAGTVFDSTTTTAPKKTPKTPAQPLIFNIGTSDDDKENASEEEEAEAKCHCNQNRHRESRPGTCHRS